MMKLGARALLVLAAASLPHLAEAKSLKRGVAYDIASPADLAALSPGVSWWYNWAQRPNAALTVSQVAASGLDYFPMLWNSDFDPATVVAALRQNPTIHYVLVLNEPNVSGQAYMTPQQAAQIWPKYETVAAEAGVKLVGPQITWGTMPNYNDPVAWLDAFYTAYEAANNGRQPAIDYLGFHWYDYGLASQLDRLAKYGKPFWVTEFANWHSQNDGAQITTLQQQETQMRSMVATLEGRADVFRYAWFTGRLNPDPHFSSLFAPAAGQLTPLGQEYLTLPY
jgi:hypothetical protein